MSVAFTREEDVESAAAHLPDRPISPHPNLVTREGLAALDAALVTARAAHGEARGAGDIKADRSAIAMATRDLRYFSARRANAELFEPKPHVDHIQFGFTVTVERDDGRRQSYKIVGEDEADVARGSVSHVSPFARAVLGKHVGEVVTIAGQDAEIVAAG